jgi:hypothetical protein
MTTASCYTNNFNLLKARLYKAASLKLLQILIIFKIVKADKRLLIDFYFLYLNIRIRGIYIELSIII